MVVFWLVFGLVYDAISLWWFYCLDLFSRFVRVWLMIIRFVVCFVLCFLVDTRRLLFLLFVWILIWVGFVTCCFDLRFVLACCFVYLACCLVCCFSCCFGCLIRFGYFAIGCVVELTWWFLLLILLIICLGIVIWIIFGFVVLICFGLLIVLCCLTLLGFGVLFDGLQICCLFCGWCFVDLDCFVACWFMMFCFAFVLFVLI